MVARQESTTDPKTILEHLKYIQTNCIGQYNFLLVRICRLEAHQERTMDSNTILERLKYIQKCCIDLHNSVVRIRLVFATWRRAENQNRHPTPSWSALSLSKKSFIFHYNFLGAHQVGICVLEAHQESKT